MNQKKKYFLLYLKTGGGHLAPAKSIANTLVQNFGDEVEPILIDGFTKTNKIVKWVIEDGYRILQAKARWLYQTIYAIYKVFIIGKISSNTISFHVKPYLREIFSATKPDKVIIFHFFLIQPLHEVLEELKISIPVITVVTDPYTAHPLWFLNKNQDFIVFSERLKNWCINKGISRDKLHLFPFILNEKFSNPIQSNEIPILKKKLGFDINKNIIIILGGGDGIPQGLRILKILSNNLKEIEIAIICGKNESLYRKSLYLKEKNNLINLKIYGYIDFIYEILNISDIVITKCGASTFMEILMCKKIQVITNYIWEQEKGNMEYLVEKKMGIYEPNIKKLPKLITGILGNKNIYQSYIENIDKEFLQNGCGAVSKFIKVFDN
jgi:processive 1,2-diacylglycerol beta-glucosyltransferase/1,2-diacylglycerol 3-beta-galactosyltransferase